MMDSNREKIGEYFTNQLEKDIKKLVDAKNKSAEERQQAEAEAKENAEKEEERLKKEREDQENKDKEEKERQEQETKKQAEEQAKQRELSNQKQKSIAEITMALNQEFSLTNSDLSSQYQNWESQINQLTDIQQITNFQDRLLVDIRTRRQDKKTAQEVKENLNKAQTGTEEEKKQAWENLEKQETEKGYNDNKEEVEKLKREKATKNPSQYSEEVKGKIEEKLKNSGIKEEELSKENGQEWQKLKGGEIKDPNQLVTIESKIKQDIYQKEVEKKVIDLTLKVNEVLKSKSKQKSQIATLKKELLEFISSSNIFHTTQQKKAAESLLNQLENYSVADYNNQNNPSVKPENSSWKIIIPFLLIGILSTTAVAIYILRKKSFRNGKRKQKSRVK